MRMASKQGVLYYPYRKAVGGPRVGEAPPWGYPPLENGKMLYYESLEKRLFSKKKTFSPHIAFSI